MSTATNQDLTQFRDFLSKKLALGSTVLTPEEALDEFLASRESADEHAECVAAVQESLREIDAGETGRLASEYIAEVRERLKNCPR